MAKREHHVMVRLDDREGLCSMSIAGRRRGLPICAGCFMGRRRSRTWRRRAEAMAILTRLAGDGKTQAACVLARELREGGEVDLMSWILDAR
jgi:hypothetical protein